jgi:hypothetical protein
MRVNVYHEELTGEAEIVTVEPAPGRRYIGLRFILASAPELHHTATDDDRSAVTLWVGTTDRAHAILDSFDAGLGALDAQDER